MEITIKILKTSVIQIYGIRFLRKRKTWWVKICSKVKVIPLNTNLLCYSFIKKAFVESDIINYASLYQIQPRFTKLSHSESKKSLDKSMS